MFFKSKSPIFLVFKVLPTFNLIPDTPSVLNYKFKPPLHSSFSPGHKIPFLLTLYTSTVLQANLPRSIPKILTLKLLIKMKILPLIFLIIFKSLKKEPLNTHTLSPNSPDLPELTTLLLLNSISLNNRESILK